MKQFIIFSVALLTSLWVATSANAEARWQYFAADPAYKTRAEAVADLPNVLLRIGVPKKDIVCIRDAMKSPGARVRLVRGDRLAYMRTGPKGLWKNVLVDFKESPAQGMEFAAPAEEWSVVCSGKLYIVGIPDVCNNTYLKTASPVLPARKMEKEPCALIHLAVEGGDSVLFGMFGAYAPSECFAVRNVGGGSFEPLPTHCPQGPCDMRKHSAYLGLSLIQSGGFVATGTGWATVRVPASFANTIEHRATFCLKRASRQTCGIGVLPEDYISDGGKRVAAIAVDKTAPRGRPTDLEWRWERCVGE